MTSGTVSVKNSSGLHARPASLFVQEAMRYTCSIRMYVQGKTYDAKSILGVLSACVPCGAELRLECEGADEAEALAAMLRAVGSGLGE